MSSPGAIKPPDPPKTVVVMDAKERPYMGLWSKPALAALGLGMMSISKNFRFDGLVPKVRYPMTRSGTDAGATAAGSAWVGEWEGFLNGTMYCVVALANGTIYSMTPWASGLRTLISATSGKYGDTRLDTLFKMVWMAPAKDSRTGIEYLVIGDGKSYCRVWNPNEADAGEKIAVNEPITPPSANPAQGIVPTFPKKFTLSDAANTSFVNSDADVVATEAGGSTASYIILTILSTVDSGDNSIMTMGSAIDLSGCPQLIVYIESTYTTFEQNVKFALIDSTGNTTIWDPSATATILKRPLKIAIGSTGKRHLLVFDINAVPAANRDAVTGVVATFVGTAPASTQVVNILGVMGSGVIQGQALPAITLMNSGSRAESPALRFQSKDITPEYMKNLGCRQDENTILPVHPGILYQYNIPYQNPTQAQLDKGVDTLVVYRSDAGEDISKRGYVASVSIAAWTASWALTNGGTVGGISVYSDNTDINSKDNTILAPDANTLTIPKGIWGYGTNERLFVLAWETTGGYNSPSFSRMWASSVFSMFRFRRTHRSEQDGTSRAFQGETAIAMRLMSSFGPPVMGLWTNSNFYTFSPTSATLINFLEWKAPNGTWCPYSVAAGPRQVWWVDQDRKVQEYSQGGIRELSSQTIQDKLDLVGGTTWQAAGQGNGVLFFGKAFNERYYLSCDQSGTISWTTGAESPLIFETRLNRLGQEYGWVEDELGAATYSTRFWISAQGSLYTLSKDGFSYRYEDPSSGQKTDGYQYATGGAPVAGTAYSATLQTGADNFGFASGLAIVRSKIWCDDVTGGAAALTYTYYPGGSAPTQSIPIDGSGTMVWATASSPPSSVSDGSGTHAAIKIVFSAALGVAGMNFYGWKAEIEPRDYRPAVY